MLDGLEMENVDVDIENGKLFIYSGAIKGGFLDFTPTEEIKEVSISANVIDDANVNGMLKNVEIVVYDDVFLNRWEFNSCMIRTAVDYGKKSVTIRNGFYIDCDFNAYNKTAFKLLANSKIQSTITSSGKTTGIIVNNGIVHKLKKDKNGPNIVFFSCDIVESEISDSQLDDCTAHATLFNRCELRCNIRHSSQAHYTRCVFVSSTIVAGQYPQKFLRCSLKDTVTHNAPVFHFIYCSFDGGQISGHIVLHPDNKVSVDTRDVMINLIENEKTLRFYGAFPVSGFLDDKNKLVITAKENHEVLDKIRPFLKFLGIDKDKTTQCLRDMVYEIFRDAI